MALAITVFAHFAGLIALVAILVRGDGVDWSSLWPKDEDDRGGGGPPSGPDDDGPAGDLGLGLPLDGGSPAPVRLREPRPLQPLRPVRRGREAAPEERPVVPHDLR